jgi:protoporphyrinogen oxidase
MNQPGIPDYPFSRRDWLLSSLAAAAAVQLSGCRNALTAVTGDLLKPGMTIGHHIRDRSGAARSDIDATAVTSKSDGNQRHVDVAIVGGGIAGLSAAWHLKRSGLSSLRIFELEQEVGGTSRSGTCDVTDFPWGAHYVPLPDASNADLIALLSEMQAVHISEDGGLPIAAEGVSCREPQERLFVNGEWLEDLYPRSVATESDLKEWDRFREIVHHWIEWRDAQGHRAFTIPTAHCSQDPDVLILDQITAADWLKQQGFTSSPLIWLVDYCCRDDYGLTIEQTSAWAAMFYFASRLTNSQAAEPPLLTWPAGNGAIVRHLSSQFSELIETNRPVIRIVPGDNVSGPQSLLHVWNPVSDSSEIWNADHVIFAAPQFLTPHVLAKQSAERIASVRTFSYGAWVVANLHLSKRPLSVGAPLSWDNVIYQSASLGYVVATHQVGSDFGPTVWTWYYPLCDPLPSEDRERLLAATWEQWAEVILKDLNPAHPNLRECLSKLDVLIWGHAMIQPRPGFVSGADRRRAAAPVGNVHFAGTDLSGLAIMEEAFYHGLRAAREVLAVRDRSVSTDAAK